MKNDMNIFSSNQKRFKASHATHMQLDKMAHYGMLSTAIVCFCFYFIMFFLIYTQHSFLYCAPWCNILCTMNELKSTNLVPPLNSYSFVVIMISNTVQRILHAFRLLIIEHTCSYQCMDFNLISDFVIPAIKSLHCFHKYINLVWS